MDQHNGKMPKTSLYREEYCLEFVRRWDELIDWEKRYESENGFFRQILSPNPPKDTDGRREDSGRGWVRELQGRWPGVLG